MSDGSNQAKVSVLKPQTQSVVAERAQVFDNRADRDDEIDLLALVATLWRGKWIIALITTLAILMGGVYAYGVAVPLYTANSVVLLETKQNQIADLESVVSGLSGDTSEVNSEVEILRSRILLGRVVDRLDLESDPEFNASLREPGLLDNVKSSVIGGIKAAIGQTEQEPSLTPEQQAIRTHDNVVSALLSKMQVSNIRQSLVFQIQVETTDPQKSADIADAIAEEYTSSQRDVKYEATEQASEWLSERVAELKLELEEAEQEVARFSSSTRLVSAEALEGLERQLKEIRDRIVANTETRTSLESQLQELDAANTLDEKAAIAGDRLLSQLAEDLDGSDRSRAAFDTRLAAVISGLQTNLTRVERQLASLTASAATLEEQITQQTEDLIQLRQLRREAEATRLLYEHFLTRLGETSAQRGIQQADSRLISSAVVPQVPSFPRKSLILALSGMLGLMLGAALILIRELRNNTFKTAADLEALGGYAVLGQIPAMPIKKRNEVLSYVNDKPTSAAAEAVRNLRTSVMMANLDNPPQTILVTSCLPAEGKTTASLMLAHNFAAVGKSVLLLEGDVRRRTLNEYFDVTEKRGLVSVLGDLAKLEDVVFHSQALGGDVLLTEESRVNAADLFSSDKFSKFIETVKTRYDVVIIDTPPVLVVPDARIIAQHADAVLFNVKWDSTSQPQVQEALRLFHNSAQRITGFILNGISARGMKYYGYGGKYGAYGAYASKYYNS
ncbi:capsular exopolysaccharide family [Roseovarius litoreus]|uniref:non-specific protein-tyrosine kinase n=1 Tax=Roseovarius litoreus TaxID=1155722 RepID=A0A1M7KVX3_9RHOB|nr:polysaccharide biosynthesis tyrosine autokinase [Roseovarius litoreus]SHM69528.1 capsular exopolysaccharide family [Roseovarius litoreus]